MDDDEALLARLAEIEGVKALPIGPDGMICDVGNPTARFLYEDGEGGYGWNPLTNDAQALGLVKKYRPEIMWVNRREQWGVGFNAWEVGYTEDESLNRAIALAIIAAHGG